ncbi:MAG: GNAT family N-acetyltransferase [Treponema sp.]|nr:GNAT family N-acetyltransferase [Treponema sp.]
MKFELDNILTDEIVFFMENQDGNFLFDLQELHVVDIHKNNYINETDFSDEQRFVTLPSWDSNDGFRLMEKFTSNLKNPVIRQELSDALDRNKGVFRAFRDILRQYPETEKYWFSFKEQEMKSEVVNWYNALREEWGLEPIGFEPEDNSSLVLEDFIFKKGEKEYYLISETASGESAGCISADFDPGNKMILHINNLEVNPNYRGMGLGKTLLAKLLEKADKNNLDVTIDLPVETDYFSRSLLLENFKPVIQRYIRKK